MVGKVDVDTLLHEAVPALSRTYHVPGLQLALHCDGRTAMVEFGEREYQTGIPVDRNSAFPIGSISKCFTATAAMILVADGDLELDGPIGAYLPDLDEICAQVSLRQLLSHTSGLGSGAVPGTVSTVSPGRYARDHCRRGNLVLAPGAGFSYSNAGFVVVGHLIEVVTGMSFWEAMEVLVLRPLGIEPSFISDPRTGTPSSGRPLANGYSVNLAIGRTRPVEQSLAPAEAPAGGLAVSAADLIALARVHLDAGLPKLLAPAYAAQMRQRVPAADPFGLASGWGLGLAVYGSSASDWFGHDGNSQGTSCYLRLNPDLGWAIAFTSNSGTGADVWRQLLADLDAAGIAVEHPPAWPEHKSPVTVPPGCVGTYDNGDVAYVISADGGQLHLAVDGGVFAPLLCQADLTFALRMPTSGQQMFCGRFLRDPISGAIDRIQVSGRLALRRAGPTAQPRDANPERERHRT